MAKILLPPEYLKLLEKSKTGRINVFLKPGDFLLQNKLVDNTGKIRPEGELVLNDNYNDADEKATATRRYRFNAFLYVLNTFLAVAAIIISILALLNS